jgi:hypothetical protein
MLKQITARILSIVVVAVVGRAAPACAVPIVFTDRAEFYAAIGAHTVAAFDAPQVCQQRFRFSCSIFENGIEFAVPNEVGSTGPVIADHFQTTLGRAVAATLPAGTTAVGFDLDFPPGVGARVALNPSTGSFDFVSPGFFGIVSTDAEIGAVVWSRLGCCEGEIQIDNVAINTVSEASSLALFGGSALFLVSRRRCSSRPEILAYARTQSARTSSQMG